MNTTNNTSNTQDLLAKLLATENVTVVRSNVSTASFDIKNRVLTLPTWKDLTPEIEEMLILHEVGHALFTSEEGYSIVYTEKRHLRGYANIIEDVRIEKKMKDRYPGSRKSFNAGYTQLNDRDFFGVRERDLTSLLFIDRINLYYKAGYSCGVNFSQVESVMLEKVNKCIIEKDVIELAEEIYNYCLKDMSDKDEEYKRTKTYVSSKSNDFEDSEELDYDSEDSEDSEDENDFEVDIEPETIENFDRALDKYQDRDSRTYYLDAQFEIHGNDDPLVSYKKILVDMRSQYMEDVQISSSVIPEEGSLYWEKRIKQQANTFKIESNNIVNYLVKEFEMRKSATAWKRTKISKLGQLDTRKLFAYKLKDDLFKQISRVEEGKKHGMVFLLDWSGSMATYMEETVQQIINLAMFCHKVNIPYQVLAFSDNYLRGKSEAHEINAKGLDNSDSFSLLELFSHKMNSREFNKMCEYLLDKPWLRGRNNTFGLSGTPLNHSLVYMVDYIGKFIKINDVEKMNLVILTDGESNALHHHDYAKRDSYGIKSGAINIVENGAMIKINAKTFIRDKVTRKEYKFTEDGGQQTASLLKLIKDRYRLRVTAFNITNYGYRSIERFIRFNIESDEFRSSSERYQLCTNIQSKLRKEKGVVLKEVPGRDETYLILSTNKIVDEDLDGVKSDMSATQISKQLTKMFTTRKTSRVVLNSFIGVVA